MMTKKESPIKAVLKIFSIAVMSVLLLFVFSVKSTAQQNKQQQQNENIVNIDSADKKPEFPGGLTEFYKFIGKNFKTPANNKAAGKIYIEFMVEKDGALSNFKILKDIGYGVGDEAVRVLKLSPKWNPGLDKDGTPVRVLYSMPMTIQPEK